MTQPRTSTRDEHASPFASRGARAEHPGRVPDVAAHHDRVARALVDAFNSRDPDAWIAVFHPDVRFAPSLLVGGRSLYTGHEGVLHYLKQVERDGTGHRSRVRLVRAWDAERFVVFTEVLLGDKVVSPAAVIVRLCDGRIIESTTYLSDEGTLDALGLTPPRST